MPHLSGFEVMEQLKHIVPASTFLPILVLTADITKEAKLKSLDAGASDFLTKPFDLIEVGLRIKNMLHASYLHQQVQNQNLILEAKVNERTHELSKTNMELKAAMEKDEESNRLKTAILNNITHEIRTPLNGILGFGQLLLDGNQVPEENELYLSLLSKSSDRLLDTITNFLDISLLNSGSQEIFKVEFYPEDTIIEAIRKFYNICREKNINLLPQIPSGNNSIKINTDKQLLYKILYQLIDNAVKFTNQGKISVGYNRVGQECHFFVKDSGIGISEVSKKSVFGSFNQENNANTRGHEGSGLGLSKAKGFVELLGGKIWLVSEKGNGSTFYFSIPSKQLIVPENDRINSDSAYTIASKQTILIAEDDMLNFRNYSAPN